MGVPTVATALLLLLHWPRVLSWALLRSVWVTSPGGPWGPVGPSEPAGPCGPAGPSGPCCPVGMASMRSLRPVNWPRNMAEVSSALCSGMLGSKGMADDGVWEVGDAGWDARRARRRASQTGHALRGGWWCGLLAAATGETLAEGLHEGVILAAGVQRLGHAVDVERGHIGIAERGHAVVTGDLGYLIGFGADGQVLAAEGDVLRQGGQIEIGGDGTGVLLGELEGLIEQGHVRSLDLGEAAAVLGGERVAAVGHFGLRGAEIGDDRITLGIGEGGGDEVLVHGASGVAGRRPWFIKPQTAVEPESSVEPSHVLGCVAGGLTPASWVNCTKKAAKKQGHNRIEEGLPGKKVLPMCSEGFRLRKFRKQPGNFLK